MELRSTLARRRSVEDIRGKVVQVQVAYAQSIAVVEDFDGGVLIGLPT